MSVMLNLTWGNLHENLSDEQVYANELRLAVMGEELGFDSIWSVEHHFSRFSMCPSNFTALATIAAKTRKIRVGLAAVILPWHDPLRVIENIHQLDLLTEGRLEVSFGRGLSRLEYDAFRIDRNEARERFDESARFVIRALETGVAEYEGKFYRQPRVEIRPRTTRSFEGRLFAAATSKDSIRPVAELGAAMTLFVQGPMDMHVPPIQEYNEVFQAKFGRKAPLPTLGDNVVCHADPAEAERLARLHLTRLFAALVDHYELFGDAYKGIKGYSAYDDNAAMFRALGKEALLETYLQSQTWGTPAQIIKRYEDRLEATGGHHSNVTFSFGGLPHAEAEKSMRLYAREVLPALKELERKAGVRAVAG